MTNKFIEHLIARSTKKTTLHLKPALTPDALPEIFQLPPNYNPSPYTEPLSFQTNTTTQKQNNTYLTNTPNEPFPQQSPQPNPQTQKTNTAPQEPPNPHKSHLTNLPNEETKSNPQESLNISPVAPKTGNTQRATLPTFKTAPQDLGSVQTDSTAENNPDTSNQRLPNEQNLTSSNLQNPSPPQTNSALLPVKKQDPKHQEPLSTYKQPPQVNSPKEPAVTPDQKITNQSPHAIEGEVGHVLVESTVERSVNNVSLHLPSEAQTATLDVNKSESLPQVNPHYPEVLRPDLESKNPLNSSKRQVIDSAEENLTPRSSTDVLEPLSEASTVEIDPKITTPTSIAVGSIAPDSRAENQNTPHLAHSEQKINSQSEEPSYVAPWPLGHQPNESLLKIQNSAQAKATDEKHPSLEVNTEQTYTKVASEVNPINKPVAQLPVDTFESQPLTLRDAVDPVLERPLANFSKKILETSVIPKISSASPDIAPNELMQDVSTTLGTDRHLKAPEKIADTESQPEKTLQPTPSLSQVPSVSPKPLPPPATVTPQNLVTQNTVDDEFRAKPPKPILPLDTPFFTKLQSPKEAETTVTIHIGRIEVHAVRAPEPPVELPRAPVLSLSDYLKQRSEKA